MRLKNEQLASVSGGLFLVLLGLQTAAAQVTTSISPTLGVLFAGQSQQFTATVTGSSNTAVVWSVLPAVGTISGSGLYTAPANIAVQQVVTVTATSQADPSRSASSPVTLLPSGVNLGISPTNVTLTPAQSQQFTAAVTGTSNTNVTWSLSSNVGTISSSGLYTAPANVAAAQQLTVTATSQADPTKAASAAITIQAVGISISPTNVTLTPAQSQQIHGCRDRNQQHQRYMVPQFQRRDHFQLRPLHGARQRRRCPATHCHRDQPGRSDQGGECGNHHPGRRDQHLANQRHTHSRSVPAIHGCRDRNQQHQRYMVPQFQRRDHFQLRQPLHRLLRQRRRCPATHCHRDQPGRSDQGCECVNHHPGRRDQHLANQRHTHSRSVPAPRLP